MSRSHELKVWPPFFDHLLDGSKRFEVRYNDRHFRVGDTINLREWVPAEAHYTGRNHWMRVRYILNPQPGRDPDCGLVAGYVVLDVEHMPQEDRPLTPTKSLRERLLRAANVMCSNNETWASELFEEAAAALDQQAALLAQAVEALEPFAQFRINEPVAVIDRCREALAAIRKVKP